MKNIIVLSSSPRKDGNSEILCKEFIRGAEENGNRCELIRLNDMKFGFCQGCYACNNLGKCFQNDGMNELHEKILKADVLVFATPVYYYCMSAQLKTFIDRLIPIYDKVRSDIYIIATAWDKEQEALEPTAEAIRGCTRDCFTQCTEKGVLLVGGATEKGTVKENTAALKRAYEMGKNC